MRSGKAGAKVASCQQTVLPEERRKISGETEMTQNTQVQAEVDRNYEEFQKMLPGLLPAYRDKFALMKGGKILGYYSTAQDAAQAAQTFIDDGLFSIQEITDTAINLGFFTYAVPGRDVLCLGTFSMSFDGHATLSF